MILDAILLLFEGIVNVLLAPLSLLNISVNFLSSISIVFEFLQVFAYIVPWSYILPLIFLVIGIFMFRITISLIKLVWNFIPFV